VKSTLTISPVKSCKLRAMAARQLRGTAEGWPRQGRGQWSITTIYRGNHQINAQINTQAMALGKTAAPKTPASRAIITLRFWFLIFVLPYNYLVKFLRI
jgi:hypothetical protein